MKEFNISEQIDLHQKAIEYLRDIELKESMIEWNNSSIEKFRNVGLEDAAQKRELSNQKDGAELIEAAFAYKTIVEQLISNI